MLTIGTVLRNRYRVEGLLGRGGMAHVYKAFDLRRKSNVALKVLRDDVAKDSDFVQRFSEEAQTLVQLHHPNIVPFYAFEQDGGYSFLVLDYVPGVTLHEYLLEKKGPLPLKEVTFILYQVGAALHYAHKEHVIHMDVKPANIMLRSDGRVLITDFGIARAAEHTTTIRAIIGTPSYMSPEQIKREKVDFRADIYSLGVVLFQMVTGQKPFTGEEPKAKGDDRIQKLYYAHVHLKPPRPRDINPRIPEGVEEIILRALEKKPNKRWPTVWSLIKKWEQVVGMSVVSTLPYLRDDTGYTTVQNGPDVPSISARTVKDILTRLGLSSAVFRPKTPQPQNIRQIVQGRLRFLSGPLAGHEIVLSQANILLGRSHICTIRVPDPYVSRKHLRFRYHDGQWFVQDQGSRGGTYVNGNRVQAARLFPGDMIQIGQTLMIFEVDTNSLDR